MRIAFRCPLLALDLGSKTGWALLSEFGGSITSAAWHYRPSPFPHPGEVFTQYHEFLGSLVREGGVQHIVYEVPFHRGANRRTELVMVGLEAMTLAVAQVYSVPVDSLNAATIKKRVTGKGNAKKSEVQAALRVRGLLRNKAGDDEADAIAVLLAVLESR